jgi:predicted nucleotidyltransferase
MFFSDDMKELIQLFCQHDVEFAVCGGFAVAHYGYVRATMDFDILVTPSPDNAKRIMAALVAFGFGEAGIAEESFTLPQCAITLGAQPNQIDLLTTMSSQPTAEVIRNAVMAEIQGVSLKIVRYEDLLTAKKEAGRTKDRLDYEELIKLRS